MKPNVTFKRVANGEFKSFLDGVETPYRIYNGCLGLSGKDTPNIYVLAKGEIPTKISGTLQMCKKAVVYSLTRGVR